MLSKLTQIYVVWNSTLSTIFFFSYNNVHRILSILREKQQQHFSISTQYMLRQRFLNFWTIITFLLVMVDDFYFQRDFDLCQKVNNRQLCIRWDTFIYDDDVGMNLLKNCHINSKEWKNDGCAKLFLWAHNDLVIKV